MNRAISRPEPSGGATFATRFKDHAGLDCFEQSCPCPLLIEAAKGSGGSAPRLLRPNNGLATRPHIGERPRASRIAHALGLDQPSITQYHRSTRPRIEAA